MSQRTERLDELLREEISAIIAREISDPRVGFVTVTKVDVDRELSHANVWVSVIGDAPTRLAAVRALGRAMPFVRHRLGHLRLKRIPELHVREDDSAERGTRVLQILDDLEHGLETPPATHVEALPAPAPLRGIPEPRPPRRRKPYRGRSQPKGTGGTGTPGGGSGS
jgi:ribosome-binding factor A